MSIEHLDGQTIAAITVIEGTSPDGYCYEGHCVGAKDVTRIEAFTKSGMHADIPYVRVWKGERPHAEFCQHNIVGVYFAEPKS